MLKKALLVVNFGGPRNLEEVSSFLETLLTDEEVIRTPLPFFLQRFLFKRIARKRAPIVAEDYEEIGGGSPIFADTEWVASTLGEKLSLPVLTFHRYLISTHASFLEKFRGLQAEEVIVFPLFPQFSYATTGSIAKWFSKQLSKEQMGSLHWVQSYSWHSAYIEAFTCLIKEFLQQNNILESEALLLFSAHGLPVSFVQKGDPYQKECEQSFLAIKNSFPKAQSLLAYQSKFGKGKWLQPEVIELCKHAHSFFNKEQKIVFIPLSFSSDHIETLFEIENLYVKPLCDQGFSAYRCPALGRREDWIQAITKIIQDEKYVPNQALVRR